MQDFEVLTVVWLRTSVFLRRDTV